MEHRHRGLGNGGTSAEGHPGPGRAPCQPATSGKRRGHPGAARHLLPGPARTGATASGQAGEEDADSGKGATLGPWAWGLIGLGLGLGAVLLWRRRNAAGERVVPPPASESGPPSPTPPSPLEQISEDIRIAYGNGDAGAARTALLAWARLAGPHNPPGNLTQLALRSPEPASRRIALLDQAFF